MKANDMSVDDDDILQLSYLLAKSAFQSGQDFLLSKFSQEALQRDQGMGRSSLSSEMSAVVRILEAFYCIM